MGTVIGISIGVYDKCLVPVLLEALAMSHPLRVMLVLLEQGILDIFVVSGNCLLCLRMESLSDLLTFWSISQ